MMHTATIDEIENLRRVEQLFFCYAMEIRVSSHIPRSQAMTNWWHTRSERADEKFVCRCQRIDEIELNWIENFNSSSEIWSRLFIVCHLPTTSNNDIPFDSIEISDRHCCYYWFFPCVLTAAVPSYSLLSSTSHLTSDDDAFTLFSKSSLCNFMLWLPSKQCIILFLLQPFIDESSHRLLRVQLNLIINSERHVNWKTRSLCPHHTHAPHLVYFRWTFHASPSRLSFCEVFCNCCVSSRKIIALKVMTLRSSVVRGDAKIPFISRVEPRLIARCVGLLQSSGEGKKNSIDEMGLKELCEALSNLFQFNDPLWYEKRSGERGWWYSVDVRALTSRHYSRVRETGEHFKWIRMRAATYFSSRATDNSSTGSPSLSHIVRVSMHIKLISASCGIVSVHSTPVEHDWRLETLVSTQRWYLLRG